MACYSLKRSAFFPNPRARVVVHRQEDQTPIRRHRHEFVEIVLVLKGEGIHETGNFRHRVGKGDVMVIGTHASHRYEETRELALANILIRKSVLPRLARDLDGLPGFHALFAHPPRSRRAPAWLKLGPADFLKVREWVDELEAETKRDREGGQLLAEAYLILIVGLLARLHVATASRTAQHRHPFGKLLAWIEEHMELSFGIPELARKAGMSERSFHRNFLTATGRTPWDYLLDRRMERAKFLLGSNPRLSIQEVAQSVGIGDSNYFSRMFQSRCNGSPSHYRASKIKIYQNIRG